MDGPQLVHSLISRWTFHLFPASGNFVQSFYEQLDKSFCIFWSPDAESQPIGKDPDAGKD